VSTKPQTQPTSKFPEHEQPLSVSQAAQLVGVSEQALRKRIRKGTLPAHKLRRGNLVVTALSPSELACAYPEIVGRSLGSEVESKPAGQPVETHAEREPLSSETVVVLREGLATAEAARSAAERRYEVAETRAQVAEEKFERALVQRGDEITRARKDVERQSMQMAMEIARARVQALPESTDAVALNTQRRWLGGVALAALIVAASALAWSSRVWGDLRITRDEQSAATSQVSELQGQLNLTLERASGAEAARSEALAVAQQVKLAVADDRLGWQELQARLEQELGAERATSETLRGELVDAYIRQRAVINRTLAVELVRQLFTR
jgi:excisionase family DNA binding protein